MSIYLIRHGETASNARRVLQHPDAPLSARGLRQAERLAERLEDAGISRILASDYLRAEQTARALARRTGIEPEIHTELRERSYGDLRGRAYADLGFDPHAPDYTPPGGESWADFHERVDRAFARLRKALAETPGPLAVVTHGLVCYSLATRVFRGEAQPGEVGGFGNTSLTIVDPEPPWRIRLLACTRHLDASSASDPRALAGL